MIRNNFKKNYTLKPSQNSTSTSKSHSEVIFNGGSTYDFVIAKGKLRQKFIENQCWNYVIPNQVENNVEQMLGTSSSSSTPADQIVEEMFAIPKPSAEPSIVDKMIEEKFNILNQVYQNVNTHTQEDESQGLDTVEANKVRLNNINKYEEEKGKLELSRESILNTLLNAITRWDKDKAIHEEKQANCMKVFTKYLGPGPLSLINKEINELKFRAAWVKLNKHYSLGAATQQNISQVISLLSNSVYNKNKSIQEHFEEMISIAHEIDQVGGVKIANELLLEYILSSIERSSAFSTYEDDIKAIRRQGDNLQKAQSILQITQSNNASKLTVEKFGMKRHFSSEYATVAVTNNKKKSKVSNVVNKTFSCIHCNKPHASEKCWSIATCSKCNVVGHIARFCPEKIGSSQSNNSCIKNVQNKNLSVADVFASKK